MRTYVRKIWAVGSNLNWAYSLNNYSLNHLPNQLHRTSRQYSSAEFWRDLWRALLTIISSSYADSLSMVDRDVAMGVFPAAMFLGPVLGHIMSSPLTESHLAWQWSAWTMMSTCFGILYVSLYLRCIRRPCCEKRLSVSDMKRKIGHDILHLMQRQRTSRVFWIIIWQCCFVWYWFDCRSNAQFYHVRHFDGLKLDVIVT